jgi:hypothetical protein
MPLAPKKKGVSVLAVSFGSKKPPFSQGPKEPEETEESESEEEGDGLDAESLIKEDLAAALKSRDASALYDAICAIVEKEKGD